MPPTSHIEPLSQNQRRFIFITAIVVFFTLVPLLVFYAIGYRFDFVDTEQNIKAVGGMYIGAPANEVQIFVDEEPVQDMRIFQRAAYVQNIVEGLHTIHVQGEGVYTWTKELPVLPHYVTEAGSINIPLVPQVRVISHWQSATGTPVLFTERASSTVTNASTTQQFYMATTKATSSYTENQEYVYLQSQFTQVATTTAARQEHEAQQAERFLFADDVRNIASSSYATTTKENRSLRLYETNDDVYVQWVGDENSVPYYFCVQTKNIDLIATWYGTHVAEMFTESTATSSSVRNFMSGRQWCRDTIRIDDKRQKVQWFDFHPQLDNTVLLLLDDGLYAVEIDDRSWQNTQLVYPGSDITALLDANSVYVQDGDLILEVSSSLLE